MGAGGLGALSLDDSLQTHPLFPSTSELHDELARVEVREGLEDTPEGDDAGGTVPTEPIAGLTRRDIRKCCGDITWFEHASLLGLIAR